MKIYVQEKKLWLWQWIINVEGKTRAEDKELESLTWIIYLEEGITLCTVN